VRPCSLMISGAMTVVEEELIWGNYIVAQVVPALPGNVGPARRLYCPE
jgi:hypothetical protein